MDKRRLLGTGCIVVGALNILNFWAPVPVPTVGPSALVLGALLVGLGFYLRAPRDGGGQVEWGRLVKLLHRDRADNLPGGQPSAAAQTDPLLVVRVLRYAEEAGGKVSVARTAMRLDIALDKAQAALDECVLKGAAYMNVDEESGITHYCFPEFLPGG
jgi:hypothetical protein